MLQPRQIYDEAVSYAPDTDSWNTLIDVMQNLYLLSLLLTADPHKAQHCFLGGIGECESEIDVFMSWAQARARRTIVDHAIWVVAPTPEHAYDFSFDHLKLSASKMKTNIFDAILGLNAFERFVYIISVVEKQSDEDCSTLLGCSQKDVMIARSVALVLLASTYTPDNHPIEASGSWRTTFGSHAA
jgi:DNA-directed RNA polymerase specialized sigma24 family protein